MMREEFVKEVDEALAKLGFSDRSDFVREAVYKELERRGIAVPEEMKTVPARTGKGGRPKKVVLALAEEEPSGKPEDAPPPTAKKAVKYPKGKKP